MIIIQCQFNTSYIINDNLFKISQYSWGQGTPCNLYHLQNYSFGSKTETKIKDITVESKFERMKAVRVLSYFQFPPVYSVIVIQVIFTL